MMINLNSKLMGKKLIKNEKLRIKQTCTIIGLTVASLLSLTIVYKGISWSKFVFNIDILFLISLSVVITLIILLLTIAVGSHICAIVDSFFKPESQENKYFQCVQVICDIGILVAFLVLFLFNKRFVTELTKMSLNTQLLNSHEIWLTIALGFLVVIMAYLNYCLCGFQTFSIVKNKTDRLYRMYLHRRAIYLKTEKFFNADQSSLWPLMRITDVSLTVNFDGSVYYVSDTSCSQVVPKKIHRKQINYKEMLDLSNAIAFVFYGDKSSLALGRFLVAVRASEGEPINYFSPDDYGINVEKRYTKPFPCYILRSNNSIKCEFMMKICYEGDLHSSSPLVTSVAKVKKKAEKALIKYEMQKAFQQEMLGKKYIEDISFDISRNESKSEEVWMQLKMEGMCADGHKEFYQEWL